MIGNNEEDRDVKEQMAARYQERVSMGYTTSGTTENSAANASEENFYTVLAPPRRTPSSDDEAAPTNITTNPQSTSFPIRPPASSYDNTILTDVQASSSNHTNQKDITSSFNTVLENRHLLSPDQHTGAVKREASTESRKSTMRELIEKFEHEKPGRSETRRASPSPFQNNKKGDNNSESKNLNSESKNVNSESASNPARPGTATASDGKNKCERTPSYNKQVNSWCERTDTFKKRLPDHIGIKPAVQAKRYLLRQMGPSSSVEEASNAPSCTTAPTRVVLRGHLARRRSPAKTSAKGDKSASTSSARDKSSEVSTPFSRAIVKKKVSLASLNNSVTQISQSTKCTDESMSLADRQPLLSTHLKNQQQQQQQNKDDHNIISKQFSQKESHHQHPQQQHQQKLPLQQQMLQQKIPLHEQRQQQQKQQQQKEEHQLNEDRPKQELQQQQQQQQQQLEQLSQEPPSPIQRKFIHRRIRRRSPADNPANKRSSTAMERYLRFLKNSSPSASANLNVLDADITGATAATQAVKAMYSNHSTAQNLTQPVFTVDGSVDDTGPDSHDSLPVMTSAGVRPTSPAYLLRKNTDALLHDLSPWRDDVQQLMQEAAVVTGQKSSSLQNSTMTEREDSKSPRQKRKGFGGTQNSITPRSIKVLAPKRNNTQEKAISPFALRLDQYGTSNASGTTKTVMPLSSSKRLAEEQKGNVSKLLSRYEEAKTVLQQHQLNRKSSDRGLYRLPSSDHIQVDFQDNPLLTEDQLADTNLIPVHLRQRRFYTSPTVISEESLGELGGGNNFFDFLSGLSSSEDDDSSYMSISERLKQIKANRLIRMGKDPNLTQTHEDDSLVNLFNNFVETANTKGGDQHHHSPAKRSRRGSSFSPPKAHSPTVEDLRKRDGGEVGDVGLDKYFSTLDKDAMAKSRAKAKVQGKVNSKSKDQLVWDSPGFKVNNIENIPSATPRSSPRSNPSRHSHPCISLTDYKSLSKPSTTVYCEPVDSEHNLEGASLYSSCVSDRHLSDVSPHHHHHQHRRRGSCISRSSHSQTSDPRIMLDEDFLTLLEQNPAFSTSGSSMALHQMIVGAENERWRYPGGLGSKADYAKNKRRAEKREWARRKPKRKSGSEEAKVRVAKRMSKESSVASSRATYLKPGVAMKKDPNIRSEAENKGTNVPFVRQDSKIKHRPSSKTKTENKSPSRLPLRQVRSNIYPKNQESSVTTTATKADTIKEEKPTNSAKSQAASAERVSPPKRATQVPKVESPPLKLNSPLGAKASRHISPGTRLRYQEPEIKVPKINRASRPSVAPTDKWRISSRIPILVTLPKDNREKKEVLVQYRRSLKTGIAMTPAFRKKLKEAAHKEWSMHEWTMPTSSGDNWDSLEADDEDSVSCDVSETKDPQGVAPVKSRRKLNRLHGICLGVWLTMAGIAHLGSQLYTCNGDEYDYYCKNDDLQCILPPVY